MNILEHYNKNNLKISEPFTIDSDTYFCKFSYNNMPFIIKTNRVCYLKNKKKSNNYINVSLTSQEYLIWFEQLYQECVQRFFEKSEEWFEDALTLSDIEYSFINPLKSNIKDNCFDIQCITDENRLHIIDSNENVISLDDISESKIIPTFHIKGVKFNSKHFILEIELHNIFVILEDTKNNYENDNNSDIHNSDENSEIDTSVDTDTHAVSLTNVVNEVVVSQEATSDPVTNKDQVKNDEPVTKTEQLTNVEPEKIQPKHLEENEINEIKLQTTNLEYTDLNVNKDSFFKIYELVNNKIKNDMVNHLRKIFIEKKIKNDIDLVDMVNDNDEEDN